MSGSLGPVSHPTHPRAEQTRPRRSVTEAILSCGGSEVIGRCRTLTATLGHAVAQVAAGAGPSQLLPAREQMAFTLGFHIILVPFGVAFTFLMLVANYRGIRRGDAD